MCSTPMVYKLRLTALTNLERLDLTGSAHLSKLLLTADLPKLTTLCLRECRDLTEWTVRLLSMQSQSTTLELQA